MRFSKILVLLTFLSLAACNSSSGTTVGASSEAPTVAGSQEGTSPASPALVPGDYAVTYDPQGSARPFILHVPPAYNGSKALPLVFILPGGGGTAMGMVKSTGMSEKADQEGFLVAYLNGTGDKPQFNCGLFTDLPDVDDVGFVRGLTEELKAKLRVDPARIYAAGFSNGAMMADRLGAELSDTLAGVAVVEGTIGAKQTDGNYLTIATPLDPIPVLMIHGKQDPVVPYDGGSIANPDIFAKSVAEAVTFWTAADGCTASPIQNISSEGNVLTDDYQNCASGSEVKLITIGSGRHEWPTLENQAQFSATDAVWEFFSQH